MNLHRYAKLSCNLVIDLEKVLWYERKHVPNNPLAEEIIVSFGFPQCLTIEGFDECERFESAMWEADRASRKVKSSA